MAGAINLAYRRGVPLLAGANDLADIPAGLASLLYRLVRCFAYDAEDPAGAEAAPEWSMAMAELAAAIKADGVSQPCAGRLRCQLGNAGPMYRPTPGGLTV